MTLDKVFNYIDLLREGSSDQPPMEGEELTAALEDYLRKEGL